MHISSTSGSQNCLYTYVFIDRFSSCMRGSEQVTGVREDLTRRSSDSNLTKGWKDDIGWRDGTTHMGETQCTHKY